MSTAPDVLGCMPCAKLVSTPWPKLHNNRVFRGPLAHQGEPLGCLLSCSTLHPTRCCLGGLMKELLAVHPSAFTANSCGCGRLAPVARGMSEGGSLCFRHLSSFV